MHAPAKGCLSTDSLIGRPAGPKSSRLPRRTAGAVTLSIVDVDYDQLTSAQQSSYDAFAIERPAGLPTPLHLETRYEVDFQGRTLKETDPNGNVTYTFHDDVNHSTRTYVGWNAADPLPKF
mgnify:CR=1 FL=1